MSEGEFQFNMWNISEDDLSGRWDWKKLRKQVMKHGVRNSLLVAPMPTASTSQILGNNEAFEPYIELGLWDNSMKESIMRANGSIQHIDEIPQDLKDLYKTVWELSMKDIIDMARQRGYFIDQSQSMNLFMQDPDYSKLTSMHFYAWKSGLKTGMYYLRTKSAVNAKQFTLSKKQEVEAPKPAAVPASVAADTQVNAVISNDTEMTPEEYRAMIARAKEGEGDDCLMCGS